MDKLVNKIHKELAKTGLKHGHAIANRITKDVQVTSLDTHFNITKEQINEAIKELQSNE